MPTRSVRSLLVPAIPCAALLLTPTVGTAQSVGCGPLPTTVTAQFARVTSGNTCLDLTQYIVPVAGRPGLFQIVAPTLTLNGNTIVFTPNATQFKVDPFINFGVTSTNPTGAATTYTFTFGTPITPGLYSSALSSGGVTVTDVSGGTTTVAMMGTTPFISSFGSNNGTLTNLGVDVTGASCTATAAQTTQGCTYAQRTSTFAPTFYNNLETTLTYTQTGLGSASWSGGVALNAATVTPEPATWALMGTGLLTIGGIARRRRQKPTA